MNVAIDYEFSNQQLADLFTTAFEINPYVNDYLHRVKLLHRGHYIGTSKDVPFYADANLYGDYNFLVIVSHPETNDEMKVVITPQLVSRGLQIMASTNAKHFYDFVSGDFDAITADVFLQCVVYGTVIFG